MNNTHVHTRTSRLDTRVNVDEQHLNRGIKAHQQ